MFYSGTQGELFIDGVKAAKVRSWTMNSSLSLLDTTTLGDTDSTSTPGIRTNTGSCSLFYYESTVPGTDSCSVLINNLLKRGTDTNNPGVANEAEKVTLRLQVSEGGVNPKFIEGDVYLTSAAMSCAVGEVLSADVSFQADGAWTEVSI